MTLYEERRRFLLETLIETKCESILDIGCGDAKTLVFLYSNHRFNKLIGIDKSEKAFRIATRNVIGTNIVIENVSFENYPISCVDAILCTEVVEHLNFDEILNLTKYIFETVVPKFVVFTTPNIEYNSNYKNLVDGLRHISHKFELTPELLKYFGNIIISKYCDYVYENGFCDCNHSSQFIIFRRNK